MNNGFKSYQKINFAILIGSLALALPAMAEFDRSINLNTDFSTSIAPMIVSDQVYYLSYIGLPPRYKSELASDQVQIKKEVEDLLSKKGYEFGVREGNPAYTVNLSTNLGSCSKFLRSAYACTLQVNLDFYVPKRKDHISASHVINIRGETQAISLAIDNLGSVLYPQNNCPATDAASLQNAKQIEGEIEANMISLRAKIHDDTLKFVDEKVKNFEDLKSRDQIKICSTCTTNP
jgi:hypothetical protein